jgi:hypothetical protein
MTINQIGKIEIQIKMEQQILNESIRVFVFPFTVRGGVEIATITEGISVPINDGNYSLLVQLGNVDSEKDWCIFSFINSSELDNTPRILKSDPEITKKEKLLLTAVSA